MITRHWLTLLIFAVVAGDAALGHPEDEFCTPGEAGRDPALCAALAELNSAEGDLDQAELKPLLDEAGQPRWRTSHSLNPVPIFIKDYSGRPFALRAGLNHAGLANVAATLVELLGFAAPPEYEPSLIEPA